MGEIYRREAIYCKINDNIFDDSDLNKWMNQRTRCFSNTHRLCFAQRLQYITRDILSNFGNQFRSAGISIMWFFFTKKKELKTFIVKKNNIALEKWCSLNRKWKSVFITFCLLGQHILLANLFWFHFVSYI